MEAINGAMLSLFRCEALPAQPLEFLAQQLLEAARSAETPTYGGDTVADTLTNKSQGAG